MNPAQRYTFVAICLHWLTALMVLGLIGAGIWMTRAINDPAQQATSFQIYQLHKSFGFMVFVCTLVRLFWRFMHPAPPLPAGMAPWLKTSARAMHALFYVLLLLMPLIGWLVVSASPLGLPTIIFGQFELPHLPLSPTQMPMVEPSAKLAHRLLGYLFGGLIVLHIVAALKHQFIDKDDLLQRMFDFRANP